MNRCARFAADVKRLGPAVKEWADWKSAWIIGIGVLSTIWLVAKTLGRLLRKAVYWIFILPLLACAVVLLFGNVFYATPRDQSYRTLHPQSAVCKDGYDAGWNALATTRQMDVKGRYEAGNNERALVSADKLWAQRLACALQHHVIPSKVRPEDDLHYSLGFLEFNEVGQPYPLSKLSKTGQLEALEATDLAGMGATAGYLPPLTQLEVLQEHFKTGSHYVIVFVHGWRHDARIGNGNVADLRSYTAHAARFLRQRCNEIRKFCDTKVTGIFVGWRGARVDETLLTQRFGSTIGGAIGLISTIPTLFDRKPVSETIAPSIVSALRSLDNSIFPRRSNGLIEEVNRTRHAESRLLVLGHSLGGNALATGLKDDALKAITLHTHGDVMPPLLGSLVVLINPAAEAAKWTVLQKEIWKRVPYFANDAINFNAVIHGHQFFPPAQKPVMISLTSAATYPPNGIRASDCIWLGANIEAEADARRKILDAVTKHHGVFQNEIKYDTATHDLFPAFKFDFRPLANTISQRALRASGEAPATVCGRETDVGIFKRAMRKALTGLASILRAFPFQNTIDENARTIGHLDPRRPMQGRLTAAARPSPAPFGTTHELYGIQPARLQGRKTYVELPDAVMDCSRSDGWLLRARSIKARQNGTGWDSDELAPVEGHTEKQGGPSAHILHGFVNGGQQAPMRANDPFWNIRAFDNALAEHNGYHLSSFICAVNQFVMDDIVGAPMPAR